MAKKAAPKFLVCTNDKEHSIVALRFACAKAKKTKSKVEMLAVLDPVDYNTIFSVADVIKQERLQDAEKMMKRMVHLAKEWSGITPTWHIREGFITDEIIKHIEEDPSINLLVLGVAADGSSNKGGLLTNLTTEIGDSYHIPLLIVPGNLTDQEIEALN